MLKALARSLGIGFGENLEIYPKATGFASIGLKY